PDDARHLVAGELDDRVLHLDLGHALSCDFEIFRRLRMGPRCTQPRRCAWGWAPLKLAAMPSLDKHDTPLPTTTVKWRFPAVHPEGRKYAVISAAVTVLAFLLHWGFLGWLLVGLTIWVATFFRDPVRTTPRGDKLIVAPAD